MSSTNFHLPQDALVEGFSRVALLFRQLAHRQMTPTSVIFVKKSIIRLGLVVVLPQKPIGRYINAIYGRHRGKSIKVSYKIIVKLNLKCPMCIFVFVCEFNPLLKIVPCHSRHIFWVKWAGQNQGDIHF